MSVKIISKFLLIAILIQGCAMQPFNKVSKNELDKIQILAINVESSDTNDSIELKDYAKGKFSGVLRGLGLGFVNCFLPGGGGGREDAIGAALIILLSPVCAIVGSVYGGIAAYSADEIEKFEADIFAIDLKLKQYNVYIEQLLLKKLSEFTPYLVSNLRTEDLSKLNLKADAILNVRLLNTELSGCYTKLTGWCINPEMSIRGTYQVQLVLSATKEILFDEKIYFYAGERKLGKWAEGGASLFHSEAEAGIRELTSLILCKVFGAFHHSPEETPWYFQTQTIEELRANCLHKYNLM